MTVSTYIEHAGVIISQVKFVLVTFEPTTLRLAAGHLTWGMRLNCIWQSYISCHQYVGH